MSPEGAVMTGYAAAAYGYSHTLTPADRQQLILDHLPQVKLIANRILDHLPSTFHLEDLVSAGIVGLIAAVDNFDASLNVKLRTYAEFKIRGAILNSIRGMDGVPSNRRGQAKQISAAMRRLEQQLQRSPTEQEVAEELGMPLSEYQDLLLEVRGVMIGSLDEEVSDGDDRTYASTVADTREELPLEKLEKAELQKLLKRGIEAMPPPERTVLHLYYLKERNLREIAEVMGVHLSRVAQLKTQGLLRLRNLLASQWPSERGLF